MKNKSGGFIKNIVVVVVLLAIVFLSQSPSFRPIAQNTYNQATKNIGPYIDNGKAWFAANVYPRVSQEVASRGEVVKQEVSTQKNNAAQNIWETIKNYFAEKFSKISGTKVK